MPPVFNFAATFQLSGRQRGTRQYYHYPLHKCLIPQMFYLNKYYNALWGSIYPLDVYNSTRLHHAPSQEFGTLCCSYRTDASFYHTYVRFHLWNWQKSTNGTWNSNPLDRVSARAVVQLASTMQTLLSTVLSPFSLLLKVARTVLLPLRLFTILVLVYPSGKGISVFLLYFLGYLTTFVLSASLFISFYACSIDFTSVCISYAKG